MGTLLSKGKGLAGLKPGARAAAPSRTRAPGTRAAAGKAEGSPAIEAMQLLGRWTRVAQGHIAFGSGCACGGADFCNLQAKDMEQHVLDYVDGKYRKREDFAICELLERSGYRKGEAGSIAEFLRLLATGERGIPDALQREVIADFARSVESLDQAMRGGGVV